MWQCTHSILKCSISLPVPLSTHQHLAAFGICGCVNLVTVYGGLALPRGLGVLLSKTYAPWAGMWLPAEHVASHTGPGFMNHRNETEEERTKARGFGPVWFKGWGGGGHTLGGMLEGELWTLCR